MKTTLAIINNILLMSVLTACGNSPTDYENYGDITVNNNNTYEVSSANHPHGWGKSNCFLCHNINNIHREDRVANSYIDLDAINDNISASGLRSCTNCHGNNGVN